MTYFYLKKHHNNEAARKDKEEKNHPRAFESPVKAVDGGERKVNREEIPDHLLDLVIFVTINQIEGDGASVHHDVYRQTGAFLGDIFE